MPRIKYQEINLRPDSLALVAQCNEIIAEYAAQDFRLTLRQLYYQLVSRDVIRNRQTEYKRLGSIVNDARLAGLIDWAAIEDRTRNVEINSHWNQPSGVIEAAARSYRNDLWRNQPYRVEVWVEKDALEGVIESACRPWDVPFFSCRGYTSQTAMWEAGQRIRNYKRTPFHSSAFGKQLVRYPKVRIIHLGDHDPSGIDMTRDIRDRLAMFSGGPVEVNRIALTREQIDEYNPPPNPAKTTDSRFDSYEAEHGTESWELDALEPTVLVNLIKDAIREVLDRDAWREAVTEQERGRAELNAISENYSEAVEHVASDLDEPEIPEQYLVDVE